MDGEHKQQQQEVVTIIIVLLVTRGAADVSGQNKDASDLSSPNVTGLMHYRKEVTCVPRFGFTVNTQVDVDHVTNTGLLI